MEQWNRAHRVPRDAAGRRYSLPQVADAIATAGWRSAGLSPLLLPLAALALAARKHRRLVVLLGTLLVYLVAIWWLFFAPLERFLVPALPVAAGLAGIGATWSTARVWRRTLAGILVAGLAANLLYSLGDRDQDHIATLVALEQLRRDEPDEPNGPSRVDPVHRYLNEAVPRRIRSPISRRRPAVRSGSAGPVQHLLLTTASSSKLMKDRSREATARGSAGPACLARLCELERDPSLPETGQLRIHRLRHPGADPRVGRRADPASHRAGRPSGSRGGL